MKDQHGRRRLLLSSVCQPFGTQYGDGFGVSYEGSHQLMWAQGVFRPRAVTQQWSIDFIAANLRIGTVTLHYPTMERFIEEARKGYTHVGIAFNPSTAHKMERMVKAVRRAAPSVEIILGGYGTALDDADLPAVEHICRGEGVAFMRRLLGEPEDAPIVQPFITQDNRLFEVPIGRVGYVFAGLGCPNGCDFCATSHYFKRRHIRLLPDGASILRAIECMLRRDPGITSFWISDEDFLLNRRRGQEFLDAIRRSNLPPLSLSIFSSVKALSNFTSAELVEMGIDWVWVGYEGKRAGYKKLEGRSCGELFADLHQHGISVLASMIIGFDYQTPEIIEEEFEELMSLRPSMTQFLIYGPAFGTPLRARMEAEGRLFPNVDDVTRRDGFSLTFEHPHIGPDEMVAIQRRLFRDAYERLGPSVYRVLEDRLVGHVSLRDHEAPRVRAKAGQLGRDAHRGMPLLPGSKAYLSPPNRRWLDRLLAQIAAETGEMTAQERLLAKMVPALLAYSAFKLRHGIGQQPTTTRRAYRMTAPPPAWRHAVPIALRRLGRLAMGGIPSIGG